MTAIQYLEDLWDLRDKLQRELAGTRAALAAIAIKTERTLEAYQAQAKAMQERVDESGIMLVWEKATHRHTAALAAIEKAKAEQWRKNADKLEVALNDEKAAHRTTSFGAERREYALRLALQIHENRSQDCRL